MTEKMRQALEATGWTKEWEAWGEARAKAQWQTERTQMQAEIQALKAQLANQRPAGSR
ncbi:MAG: hypothetical protein LBR23_09510 [Spirochaetaceae bacterium]|nr:hypothetical protein [Spirochaetaceae bacterium]